MNREEAFKILEARILELLSRISHLEEENARLQKDLSSKAAQLQAAQAKVNIAAEQLHRSAAVKCHEMIIEFSDDLIESRRVSGVRHGDL